MSDKIKEIRDRVEQDVAKGPANKEIYRVHKDRAFLLAEVDRLRRHVDALQEKVSAESCACGYDSPDAVCLAHSPQLSAALADVERLTRERDEARAKNQRLRAERDTLLLDAADFVRWFDRHYPDPSSKPGHPWCVINSRLNAHADTLRALDSGLGAKP